MKKICVGLLIVIGLLFSPIGTHAQVTKSTEIIQEEKTPEAGPRKKDYSKLVFEFSLFSCFVLIVSAVVVAQKNKKAFVLSSVEENDDGSFTVNIRANNIKKLNVNPDDMHVVIRRGNCIFLKKPDLSKGELDKGDELFVVVVNQKSKIDFMYKDEVFSLDGVKLKELSK